MALFASNNARLEDISDCCCDLETGGCRPMTEVPTDT
jgi:hypothetical protein